MNPLEEPLTTSQILDQLIGKSYERSVVDAEDSDTFIEFTSFLLKIGILPEFKLEKEDKFRFNLCHRLPELKNNFILGSFSVRVGTRSNKQLTESDWIFSFDTGAPASSISDAKVTFEKIAQGAVNILTKNDVSPSKVAAFLVLTAHTFYADPAQYPMPYPQGQYNSKVQSGFIAREQARRINQRSEASILEFLKTDMSIEEIAYWLAIGVPVEEALVSKGIPISYLNSMNPVGL